jgi:hypothetical protein
VDDRQARHLGELLQIVRDRVANLGISHLVLDELVGWQSGYSGKILSPVPAKRLSPFFSFLALEALGLKMTISEDAEALAKVQSRLSKSKKRNMHRGTVHRSATIYFDADFIRMRGRKGGMNSRKNLSRREARRLARLAAKARWAKHREKEAAAQNAEAA